MFTKTRCKISALEKDFILGRIEIHMTLRDVKISLNKISKSLENIHNSREMILKSSRDVINSCSQSIISVHKGDVKSAKTYLKNAQELIKKIKKNATNETQRHLVVPEQEIVEAASLIAIVENKEIPSITSFGVSDEAYVMGLLDCIGELKRHVFDRIRNGDLEDAKRIFEVMENLYLMLYPFASYDKILKETRRKLDVNRGLVEDVRGAITEEIRRNELIKAIKKLKTD